MKKFDQVPFSGEIIPPSKHFRARTLEACRKLADRVAFIPVAGDERVLTENVLEAVKAEHAAQLFDVGSFKMRRIN